MGIPIRQSILDLKPYIPGKPIEEVAREFGVKAPVKLASNENPLGPSPRALEAVRSCAATLHRYPDGSGRALREAIARKWGVASEQVVLGNGTNEILELACRAYLSAGDEAVFAEPTFSLYRLFVETPGGRSIVVPLKEGVHDLETMAARCTPGTRLVFVCNPNNPTGTIVRQGDVERFLGRLPEETITIFDEAYADFAVDPAFPDSVGFIRSGAPVIMLRTFSKLHGLAGARIGYGVMPEEVAQILNRVRQPFNTSAVAQAAALAALSDDDHIARTIALTTSGRGRLAKLFAGLGLQALPSEANFVYVNVGRDGREVYEKMLRRGIIIRHFEGNWIRVSIGLPDELDAFENVFKAVLKEKP